ncbi:MAG: transporter, partial [Duncaniella sp.]|nr:transporter [Duncaniella sp.]
MEWLINLLGPGHTELASTLVLYSFVIASGIFLGKMKIGGVSLGVTFVLFVGIIMGHFGYVVNAEVLKFVREFGLILFIFAIGIQVGPGFFSSFKKGGVLLNALAVLMIALDVAIVLAIYYIDGGGDISALVGVMSGAVTNTPGLAAAQQAAGTTEAINTMSMAYAAAYPIGVLGIIATMLLLKAVYKINPDDEIQKIQDEIESSQRKPLIISYEVTNTLIDGKSLFELHEVLDCDFVVSRLMGADGKVVIPTSKTELHVGDKIFVVLDPNDAVKFTSVVGHKIEMDWEEVQSKVVSRRILVTQSKYNGTPLGDLRLHTAYSLNCTRVNRAGVDLLASPGLRLQIGDRLVVVGDP